ncbi:MAG: hypothetical protein V3V08_05685 [Nannocystaceae bacterium]
MITDTTPTRGGPHLPRNHYRREGRGPAFTGLVIAAVLISAIWISAGLVFLYGTAPIRPNLAAPITPSCESGAYWLGIKLTGLDDDLVWCEDHGVVKNLAAPSVGNRGVAVPGAADGRIYRQPGSSGGRITASESRVTVLAGDRIEEQQ